MTLLAGRSFVFSIDLAVTEMYAIGLGEACETDLYKALIGARTQAVGAEMRMWTVWCVSMYFFGARARITQTSSLVLKEDDKATLTCSQNDNHNSMYWYLQQPGKGLQLIYYSIGVNQQFEGDFHIGYKAQRPNRSDFSLDILSVKMNYSAVYFCASSLNTALQSHFLSLHKLLSFSVLSLRREPLSAQEEGM